MSEQELVLSVRHVTSGYRAGGVFRRIRRSFTT